MTKNVSVLYYYWYPDTKAKFTDNPRVMERQENFSLRSDALAIIILKLNSLISLIYSMHCPDQAKADEFHYSLTQCFESNGHEKLAPMLCYLGLHHIFCFVFQFITATRIDRTHSTAMLIDFLQNKREFGIKCPCDLKEAFMGKTKVKKNFLCWFSWAIKRIGDIISPSHR